MWSACAPARLASFSVFLRVSNCRPLPGSHRQRVPRSASLSSASNRCGRLPSSIATSRASLATPQHPIPAPSRAECRQGGVHRARRPVLRRSWRCPWRWLAVLAVAVHRRLTGLAMASGDCCLWCRGGPCSGNQYRPTPQVCRHVGARAGDERHRQSAAIVSSRQQRVVGHALPVIKA